MPSGNQRGEPAEHAAVHLQRGQVARVDPDDLRAGVHRPVQFVLGVHLDQRDSPIEVARSTSEIERVLLQRGHDQQDQVGAVGPGLPELVRADHEVLLQHRHADHGADRGQVVQAAAELAGLGQHTDHARPAGRVVHGQGGRVGDGRHRALGRAGPLHLGDDHHVFALERGHRVLGRRRTTGHVLELIQRDVLLPGSEIGTDPVKDLVQHAHAVSQSPRALGLDSLRTRS